MELDVEALRAKYREGGRKDDEFRKITLSRSILNRADGSAKVVIGNTMVLVGVLAPKKPMLSVKEDFYQATIKVDIEYLNTKTSAIITEYGVTTKEMVESLIQRTLFPRSDIIVNVQIICDDGSVLPAILQATFLALIDAQIPVVSNIYAMSICVTPDGRFILDPEQDEEEKAIGSCIFGFNEQFELNVCKTHGRISEEQLFKIVEMGKSAARHLKVILDSIL